MSLKKYLAFAGKIAASAGQKLLADFDQVKDFNRDASVKSRYDLKIDRLIVGALKKEFPDHSILSEESGRQNKNSDYFWVIDPIDGTGNFLNHNPFFSISIALWFKNQPVLGLVEAPFLKERYLAVAGGGAWLINLKNQKKTRARVSEIKKLNQSYFLFCGGHTAKNQGMLKIFEQFLPRVKSLRKLGSAAIELAWVGMGRAEALILPRAYLWDVAAGVLFLQEAGGQIFNFNLKSLDLAKVQEPYRLNLLATNGRLKLLPVAYAQN